jgi:hypothetical protein
MALRQLNELHLPVDNPLLDARVVLARAPAEAPSATRAEALRTLVSETIHRLESTPRNRKLHAALQATFVDPAGTQEETAEALDLPFSTYRRHLSDGIAAVVDLSPPISGASSLEQPRTIDAPTERAYRGAMRTLACVILLSAACAAPMPAGVDDDESNDAKADSLTKSGDWREATVLPYAGDWLDGRAVLDGLAQVDHLTSTTRDDVRCGAMVGTAAAILTGRASFDRLLTRVEQKRAGSTRDRTALAVVRHDTAVQALTTRDLHRFADALLRAYVPGSGGSSDGQISEMIRGSGLEKVDAGSSVPADVIAGLAPGELFPLSLDIYGDGTGWHVTLVWMDDAGAVWLYTSVDHPGGHVAARDTDYFNWHLAQSSASDPLMEKFRVATPH